MKRGLWIVTVVICLALLSPLACASKALVDMLPYDEDREPGIVLDLVQTQNGMLLTGTSEYMINPWVIYLDANGKERWKFSDELDDMYLSPSALANGGFSFLRRRVTEAYDYESTLLFLNASGQKTDEIPLPLNTVDLLLRSDSFFALGYQGNAASEGSEEPGNRQPFLARLNAKGQTLWSYTYENPAFLDWTFRKGVIAGNSLIISGRARSASSGDTIGTLCRIKIDGTVLWCDDVTPDLGNYTSINDFCVTDDGRIAMICTDMAYDEEYGPPSDRASSVFALNMDGEVVWSHELENGAMPDYILPVAGGFLCGSQGLDLENCPFIGDGWLLLLDREGNIKAADQTPDIGGGQIEVYGMANSIDGEVLLYGTRLESPGFPSQPFAAQLSFPEAYR